MLKQRRLPLKFDRDPIKKAAAQKRAAQRKAQQAQRILEQQRRDKITAQLILEEQRRLVINEQRKAKRKAAREQERRLLMEQLERAVRERLYARHYVTLGLTPPVSREEIKAAYRDKAKAMHPDHGGSDEQFCKLTEAYHALMRSTSC